MVKIISVARVKLLVYNCVDITQANLSSILFFTMLTRCASLFKFYVKSTIATGASCGLLTYCSSPQPIINASFLTRPEAEQVIHQRIPDIIVCSSLIAPVFWFTVPYYTYHHGLLNAIPTMMVDVTYHQKLLPFFKERP